MLTRLSIIGLIMLVALPQASAPASSKLDPELADKLKDASGPIPAFVLLAAQSGLDETSWHRAPQLSKAEWRNRVIEELRREAGQTQGRLMDQMKAAGMPLEKERAFWIVNGLSIRATPDVLRRLAARDDVAQLYFRWEKPKDVIRKEGRFTRAFEQPNPRPISLTEVLHQDRPLSWNLTRIQADLVWSRLRLLGRGAVMAILDSGVNYRHTDLVNHLWRNEKEIAGNGIDDDGNGYVDDIYGYNFANDNSNIDDDFFHGTSSAGIMAGDGRGGVLTGVAPGARLMVLRIYDQMTRYNNSELWRAYQYDTWEAFQYAVVQGADVINMSVAWEPSEHPIHAAWRYAATNVVAAGVVMTAGSGNFRGYYSLPDQVRPPASVPAVIATGGTLEDDSISPLSSRGPTAWSQYAPFSDYPPIAGLFRPQVSAPFGDFPVIAFRGRGYQILSGQAGSSLTSPHVAGVVALMLEHDPELRPDQILDRLQRSARDVGELGVDPYTGAGLVQAYDAIMLDDLPHVKVTRIRVNATDGSAAMRPGSTATVTLDLSNTGALGTRARFGLASGKTAWVSVTTPEVVVDRLRDRATVTFPVVVSRATPPGSLVPLTLNMDFARAGRSTFDLELPVYGSRLLLVDDDGGGEYERAWKASLVRLGIAFDLFSTWRQDPATLPDLARYATVVWVKGEEFVQTVTAERQQQLSRLVAGGGRLVLTGQRVAADLRDDPWLAATFGVRFVESVGRGARLKGVSGGVLDGLDAPYGIDTLPNAIAPIGSAQLLIGIDNPAGAGLAIGNGRAFLVSAELGDVKDVQSQDRMVDALVGLRGQGTDARAASKKP